MSKRCVVSVAVLALAGCASSEPVPTGPRQLAAAPRGCGTFAYLADGQTALCTVGDGTLRLLDARTGAQKQLIDVFRGVEPSDPRIGSAAASADGGVLAALHEPSVLEVFDGRTGATTLRVDFGEPRDPHPESVAVSADGAVVAAVGYDYAAVWTKGVRKDVPELMRQNNAAVSPDGRWVVVGHDGLKVYDTSAGRLVELGERTADCDDAAFSADGGRLACADSRRVTVYDTATWKPLRTFDGPLDSTDRFHHVGLSADGKLVVGSDEAIGAWSWNVDTGRLHAAFLFERAPLLARGVDVHFMRGADVSLSPDGQWLAADVGTPLALYDPYTGLLAGTFVPGAPGSAGGAAASAAAATSAPAKLVLEPAGHTGEIMDLAFTPDGRSLLSVSKDKTLRVWDVATGEHVRAIRGAIGPGDEGQLFRLAVSPDGGLVAVGGFLGPSGTSAVGDIRVFSIASGELATSIHLATNAITALEFSADGRWLAAGSLDGMARVWKAADVRAQLAPPPAPTRTPEEVTQLWSFQRAETSLPATGAPQLHANAYQFEHGVTCVAVSPDGRRLVACLAGGGDAALVEIGADGLATGTKFLEGHDGEPIAAAWRPDGSAFVTADAHAAYVWQASGSARDRTLASGFSLAADGRIAFSADGKLVAIGRQVYEFETGKEAGWLDKKMTVRPVAFRASELVATAGVLAPSTQAAPHAIDLWDPRTGKPVRQLAPRGRQFRGVAFLDGGLRVALVDDYTFLDGPRRFAPGDVKKVFDFGRLGFGAAPAAPVSNRLVLEAGDKKLGRPAPDASGALDLAALQFGDVRVGQNVSGAGVTAYTLTPSGNALVGSLDLRLYDPSGKELRRFEGHAGGITALALSADGKLVASLGDDNTLRLWKLDESGAGERSVRPLVSLFVAADDEWVAWAEDFTYASSRLGGRNVGFQLDRGRDAAARFYPFEQFDLRLNRPDKLLATLGAADPALVAATHRAWQKRVQRMGFTEDRLEGALEAPAVALLTRSHVTKERSAKVKFTATGTRPLVRAQLYANDVPVFGRAGLPLAPGAGNSVEREVDVALAAGANRLQVSVFDEGGVESARETINVVCDVPTPRPTLWVVAIGVSSYVDSEYDLTYAAKDASDLAALLASRKQRFAEVKVLGLHDAGATREKVLEAKAFLQQSAVDDEAIVFFAGHGLLDAKLDYFLAMHDVDFGAPAGRGLAYDELEGLLDGIPARNKLLLIDACHSGEVDKAGTALADAAPSVATGASGGVVAGVKSRGFKKKPVAAGAGDATAAVGLEGSFELMQKLFADLRRASGAAVISSAGGKEFAYEAAKWKNGVFTYSLLDGLQGGAADRDRDGVVRVSELRDFVSERVQRLTDGQQTPTARRENLAVDFAVYLEQRSPRASAAACSAARRLETGVRMRACTGGPEQDLAMYASDVVFDCTNEDGSGVSGSCSMHASFAPILLPARCAAPSPPSEGDGVIRWDSVIAPRDAASGQATGRRSATTCNGGGLDDGTGTVRAMRRVTSVQSPYLMVAPQP